MLSGRKKMRNKAISKGRLEILKKIQTKIKPIITNLPCYSISRCRNFMKGKNNLEYKLIFSSEMFFLSY
jgi:hypothetical protein